MKLKITNNPQPTLRTLKLKVKFLVLLFTVNCSLFTIHCFSQSVSINTSGLPADASSMLDISSTSQGLLIPRMTTAQRNTIPSPALSLLIFNTTTNCYESYVSGAWYSVSCPTPCSPPASPAAALNISTASSIVWNWNSVSGATGYKWSSANNYANASDNAAGISYTQSGLTCNTNYTLYVWSYNICGNSSYTVISKSTSSCTNCTATGIITTVAGNGSGGYNGDGIPATNAQMNFPLGVAEDASGNLYIADFHNLRIRKVDASSGLISTIAGTGTGGYNGEGIPATAATIQSPLDVALDGSGNVYFVDDGNQRIRKINVSTGLIYTIAGNGTKSFNGDGIAATNAFLNDPVGFAIDGSGNVYIVDTDNQRIRKVTVSTGIISTVAGNGTGGYTGDGMAATNAEVNSPYGVAVDGSGNVYIADRYNHRVRKVTISTGLISTLAGNGTAGYNGDGIQATAAQLNEPNGIFVDNSGNVYIADDNNHRIRKITVSTGIITTIAGNGIGGYNGDGIQATAAKLYYPFRIYVNSSGTMYIADQLNERVRKVCP
jgi:hypothetical protein